MNEISMNAEKARGFFKEAIPEVKRLRELAEKYDIKQGIRIYVSDDDYFSIEGNGLDGWSASNYGGETTIKHEYREVLKMEGEDNADNQ